MIHDLGARYVTVAIKPRTATAKRIFKRAELLTAKLGPKVGGPRNRNANQGLSWQFIPASAQVTDYPNTSSISEASLYEVW